MCTRKGLVNAGERIVVVQKVHEDLTLKIVSVDELGHGIKKIRHQSLQDLVAAAGCVGWCAFAGLLVLMAFTMFCRGADSRALRQSFSVISGGQGLVAEDFEPLSLSPRCVFECIFCGEDLTCAHHRSHSLNSEADTPVMRHQQSLSGVVTHR